MNFRFVTQYQLVGLALSLVALATASVDAQFDFDNEPIEYSTAPVSDRVSKLQQRLDAGASELKWDDKFGYLPSILKQLELSADSQTLVFSKTSLQIRKVSRHNPRAIYFNDDTYVGWVPSGDIIELSAVDPQQGAIFYTIDQARSNDPVIKRDQSQCMTCHATSKTAGVPGYLVRSVFAGPSGQPHYSLGTITTDHKTKFKKRFGGWFVTGKHGLMRHRGNVVARNDPYNPIDIETGANRTALNRLVRTENYLRPTSDVVALMVLEHQSQMHNRITLASYETRRALHHQQTMNKVLGDPPEYRSQTTTRRIQSAGDELLEYLLFSDEYELEDRIRGDARFVEQFVQQGPKDSHGRSLRDFDLTKRLFRYPCSHLIYSESFDQLPDPVLEYTLDRLARILLNVDQSSEFAHLDKEDRQDMLEILCETKPEFAQHVETIRAAARSD